MTPGSARTAGTARRSSTASGRSRRASPPTTRASGSSTSTELAAAGGRQLLVPRPERPHRLGAAAVLPGRPVVPRDRLRDGLRAARDPRRRSVDRAVRQRDLQRRVSRSRRRACRPPQFSQMDARRIPFRDEFDVIGAFDVLEHIEEDDDGPGRGRQGGAAGRRVHGDGPAAPGALEPAGRARPPRPALHRDAACGARWRRPASRSSG